jgi:Holliday junction DNA helicase RuvA
MIGFLQGKLDYKSPTEIVINCGGVGYSVNVSVNTSEKLPMVGETVKVLTILIHKEDSMQLYGFLQENERQVFRQLTSISGIGPKIALGILSSLDVARLQEIVMSGNQIALQKLPGVGKKTAERLILELRDKIYKVAASDTGSITGVQNLIEQEALSALMTLGYSRPVAEKALRKAVTGLSGTQPTAEELLKDALRFAMG